MTSSLPPDPYAALGVPKDATSTVIKSAYRKLVLKCHPDKVTDPAAKQAAVDQFHKIQTAYEIVVDDERRARYDAAFRLHELRKEVGGRNAGSGSSRDVRPSSTSERNGSREDMPSYRSTYPPAASRSNDRFAPQYEERRPAYADAPTASPTSYETFDLPTRASARKEPDSFVRPSRHSKADKSHGDSRSAAKEAERAAKDAKAEQRRKNDRQKDRALRQERTQKFPAAGGDPDSDLSDRSDRRSRRAPAAEESRRSRDEYFDRMPSNRRSPSDEDSDYRYAEDRARKQHDAVRIARDYMRSQQESRSSKLGPEPSRSSASHRMRSSRDHIDYEYDYERPRAGREYDYPRRDSARDVRGRQHSADGRPSKSSRPPPLQTAVSSPPQVPVAPPAGYDRQRAQSVQVDDDAGFVPGLRRSATDMPSSSRRAESYKSSRGTSRATDFADGMPTSAATPEWAPKPSQSSKYSRSHTLEDQDYSDPFASYRTEVRQPASSRPENPRRTTRSPSPSRRDRAPLSRDPSFVETKSSRPSNSRLPSHASILSAATAAAAAPSPVKKSTTYRYSPGNATEKIQYTDADRPRYFPSMSSRMPSSVSRTADTGFETRKDRPHQVYV